MIGSTQVLNYYYGDSCNGVIAENLSYNIGGCNATYDGFESTFCNQETPSCLSSSDGSASKLSAGAVAGIVIAVFVFLGCAGVICLGMYRYYIGINYSASKDGENFKLLELNL